MQPQKITTLKILIDVLKDNYGDYYNKYIGHDFLDSVLKDDISDSIAYLMEHVRKLKKKDKEYSSYLKHCYAIFLELQHLVRNELVDADKVYVKLLHQQLMTKSVDRHLLLDIAIHDEDKMKNFCKEVKNDKQEFFSEVIINVIKEYECFKDDKTRKLDNLNHYSNYFIKSFDDLMK